MHSLRAADHVWPGSCDLRLGPGHAHGDRWWRRPGRRAHPELESQEDIQTQASAPGSIDREGDTGRARELETFEKISCET